MNRRNPWQSLGVGLIKVLLGSGLLVTSAKATAVLPAMATWANPAIAQANPRLPAAGLPLQPGQTGDEVRQLQAILAQLGWYEAALDGLYGPTTTEAVQAFQAHQGLPVDGIVGPQTWQRLTLYGSSQNLFSQMPQLQPDTLVFTLLTVTPPVPPPSPLWLLLMPTIPLVGGGLTYLHHRRQTRR
jgi:peptidoglycan hydrolase-like protein with peptidoglycan-binding domain